MRGPLLWGPLGSQPTLEALLRWTQLPGADAPPRSPVVVLGPPWLGAAMARGGTDVAAGRARAAFQALRTHRRAKKESQPLDVALAAAELPFGRGTLSALVVENVAGLPPAEGERWIAALTPLLRPGGRLIAADATSSDAAAARVARGASQLPPCSRSCRSGRVRGPFSPWASLRPPRSPPPVSTFPFDPRSPDQRSANAPFASRAARKARRFEAPV